MSADEKVPGGRQCDDGARKQRDADTRAPGTSAGTSKQAGSTIDSESQSSARSPQRPRAPNQDVLPGILGKQLRAAYGELLSAPVPDQFTDLIKRLESKEAASEAARPDKPSSEESG